MVKLRGQPLDNNVSRSGITKISKMDLVKFSSGPGPEYGIFVYTDAGMDCWNFQSDRDMREAVFYVLARDENIRIL